MQGILLVNKPRGKTSFQVVAALRRILQVQKIGHTGTLDPFATGLLVMLVGKAYTKMSDQLISLDKSYETTLLLGSSTDSYDCDGVVQKESSFQPSLSQVETALQSFQGNILQTPPMFSAKKIGGQKLCDLARRGKEIARQPQQISLQTILKEYTYPHLRLEVHCSKGTYIRSIGHDLGEMLNSCAHLIQLHRLRCGQFHIEDAIDGTELFQPSDSTKDLIEKSLRTCA